MTPHAETSLKESQFFSLRFSRSVLDLDLLLRGLGHRGGVRVTFHHDRSPSACDP